MQLDFDLKRFLKQKVENELSEELIKSSEKHSGALIIKPANWWLETAKKRPIPNMLFDVFWHEGEVCILYADSNLGKSMLAVQIADSISRGLAIQGWSGFEFKLGVEKQKVLFFDFEHSDKQFETKYSNNYSDHYCFDDNLIRIEINPDSDVPENRSFTEYLIESMNKAIINSDARIVIIDNLTYLRDNNEKAQDALPLMKELKQMKNKYHLSILVIAHTPKRDHYKPLTNNDLHGSKMLMNFCDSSFAIGESFAEQGIRYLKQIKQRNTECVYHTENVLLCMISKPSNFIKFEQIGFGSEREHLKVKTKEDDEQFIDSVMRLHEKNLSYREIGEKLNISHTQVGRIIKKNKI